MALIAICVWSMVSEINGTLKLARTLTQAGHRVCYMGIPDCRSIIEENSFDFVPVLERWLPAGSVDDERFYKLARLRERRRIVHAIRRKLRFERVLRELLRNRDNDIEKAFRRLKPDLVIIGTHTPHAHIFSFIAARLGIRCAYLTQQMFYTPAPTALDPPTKVPLRHSLKNLYDRIAFRCSNINYDRFFEAFLDATGLPQHQLNPNNGRYPLRAPILYSWPSPFELSGTARESVLRIETGAQLDRYENTTLLNDLETRSALIYCSFGTLLPLGLEPTRALLKVVIGSMHEMPDVQMVLTLGPYFKVSEFDNVPANVKLCSWTSQVSILKRSDVVITNGGSATVSECLLLGIPMIVIPLGYESAEYAKRVAHHQLGFNVDYRNLSDVQMSALIRALLADTKYKQAAMLMKASIEKWERCKPSLKAIDICLGTGRPREFAIAIP